MGTRKSKTYLAGIGEYINAELAKWKIPGVGVAVVDGDDVVLCEGYGLREAETALPATGDTLFAIGSNSKSFTTAVLATLVDEGKLDWDRPVREYIPWFRMQDAFATERMTARDLCSHRSGLPRHDLLWIGSKLSRRELVERVRYLEPTKDFRTTWQYQNLMYTTAGYLAEVITGQTWESLVAERIFKPLGMTRSCFAPVTAQEQIDCSRPYAPKGDVVRQVPAYDVGAVGPAGSIYSSAREMASYVRMQLSLGKFDGKQVVSEAQIGEMHFPTMPMAPNTEIAQIMPKEFGPGCYGLGWFVQPYRNNPCVWHAGGIDGYISFMGTLPERNAAVVVLSNSGGSQLSYFLGFHIFDLLLGLEPLDWSARLGEMVAKMKAMMEEAKKKAMEGRVPDTRPSHALDAYAGEYRNVGYGSLLVEKKGDELQIRYNLIQGLMAHFHYDDFTVTPEKVDMPVRVSFQLDAKGGVGSVSVPLEGSLKPIVFTRA